MRSMAADNLLIYSVADILGDESLADEYTYFNSDHHWTPKGCYYAYREMMIRQGIIPVSWDDHAITQHPFFGSYHNGSLPLIGNIQDTLEVIDPMTESQLYIIERADKVKHRPFILTDEDTYSKAYIYGNVMPWGVIESRCNTGRKCLVLYDSFGKPLFPLLANHYDEQFMIDLRHYSMALGGGKLSRIIETYGINDIYIVIMPFYVFGDYTLNTMNNCM